VRKYSLDGKLLLKIGSSGKPAPFMSGLPFHRCTHTALAPNGDIYVSDGYGNARVHRYSPDGRLLGSWGEPGTGPGQFNIVHNICCDADGWVYVADRENHRIQVFDGNGKYETQWNDLYRPCGLCMCCGANPLFYVAELAPGREFSNRDWPGLGPRVSILDRKGTLLARLGDYGGPDAPSPFIAPHGIAVDSQGAIYVAELSHALMGKKAPSESGRPLTTLQKLSSLTEGS
jgi:sugar lactone lactonase YvrE